MKVVGMVSSFREGPMLRTAIQSLTALDHVVVFEGPVEGNDDVGPVSELPKRRERISFQHGVWESDAAKRTAMLAYVKTRPWFQDPEGVWGLWLDGDELLLWGEYLHDWLWRVRQQGDDQNPVAGWPFPLVELDGSVAICLGKLVRLDLISRYLVSSSYIEMVDGSRRTVGNTLYWTVKDGPLVENWRARPPLAGEPHLQHRPVLRSKLRVAERQHQAEARNYQGVELP